MRPEQKFETLDGLVEQLRKDEVMAQVILSHL